MPSDVPLPLHLVTDPSDSRPVVKLGGRPKKVRLAPRADAVAYAKTIRALREKAIETNALVRVLEDGGDLESCVATIKLELASESALMAWEAQHAVERGRDPSNYSVRRINALTTLASVARTALRLGVRRELDRDILSRLQELFVVAVETVARETAPGTSAALVEKLRERLAATSDSKVECTIPPQP